MAIKKIPNIKPESSDMVKVKLTGNITEIQFTRVKAGSPIQKIDKDHGIDKRTGELVEYQHNTSRAGSKASVSQSLRKLRDIINANLTNPKTALWVTMTYAEVQTDTKRLYEDFHAFWKRFRRYLERQGYPQAEYISAAEPQQRMAWHLHCLFLFPGKAPYIPNSDMAQLWGHGFTKTKGLKGMDNIGLYLTVYMADMELTEAISAGTFNAGRLSEAEIEDEQGQKQKKAVIKGARLHLYPPGFNLYRCSRGVKRPEVQYMTEGEAQKIVKGAPLTYEKTIAITDSAGQTVNVINYRQYNRARQAVEDKGNTQTAKQPGGTEAEVSDNGPKV